MQPTEKAKISDLLLRIMKGEIRITANDLMKRGNTDRVITCIRAMLAQKAKVGIILSEKNANGFQSVMFGNSLFAFILANIIHAYDGRNYNDNRRVSIWGSNEFKKLGSTIDMSEDVLISPTTYFLNLHTLEISRDYAFTEGRGTWYRMERLFSLYGEEDISDRKLQKLAEYANILFDFEVDIQIMKKDMSAEDSAEYFFHF